MKTPQRRYPSDVIYRAPVKREVGPDDIRLWTVMAPETFDLVLEQGSISGREDLVIEGFENAYRWMLEQMRVRIPGYAGQFPIWAWVGRKPDFRTTRFREWERPSVVIEWAPPAHQVLVSYFHSWHAILNRSFLPIHQHQDEAWDNVVFFETGRDYTGYDNLPSRLQRMVRQSWSRIFDTDTPNSYDDEPSEHRDLQAVVPEMRLEHILLVRELSDRSYIPFTKDDEDTKDDCSRPACRPPT